MENATPEVRRKTNRPHTHMGLQDPNVVPNWKNHIPKQWFSYRATKYSISIQRRQRQRRRQQQQRFGIQKTCNIGPTCKKVVSFWYLFLSLLLFFLVVDCSLAWVAPPTRPLQLGYSQKTNMLVPSQVVVETTTMTTPRNDLPRKTFLVPSQALFSHPDSSVSTTSTTPQKNQNLDESVPKNETSPTANTTQPSPTGAASRRRRNSNHKRKKGGNRNTNKPSSNQSFPRHGNLPDIEWYVQEKETTIPYEMDTKTSHLNFALIYSVCGVQEGNSHGSFARPSQRRTLAPCEYHSIPFNIGRRAMVSTRFVAMGCGASGPLHDVSSGSSLGIFRAKGWNSAQHTQELATRRGRCLFSTVATGTANLVGIEFCSLFRIQRERRRTIYRQRYSQTSNKTMDTTQKSISVCCQIHRDDIRGRHTTKARTGDQIFQFIKV